MARFFRRGKSKVYFLPAIANASGSPTRAEITSGTDLSPNIAEIAGFSLANDPIATPDLATPFTKSIPGEDTTDASSLTFYDDDTATTVRTALVKGTAGYIVLMPYGDVPTKRCEVWKVQTTGVNDEWSIGNDAARFVVGFSISDTPVQNAVIPN